MAGIYIHIPFCKRKCHYCNFYSVPSLRRKDDVISALHKELNLQKQYPGEVISTVYFGGGTPSILTTDEISRLIDIVYKNYAVLAKPEITMEVNPDDITKQKVRELQATAVNRISVGVQSFSEDELNFLGRAHTSHQADYAVKALQDAGVENLSIDIIYGIPVPGMEWKHNLQKAVEMRIPHLSVYALTVEPNTNLEVLIRQQKRQVVSADDAANEFHYIMNFLREKKYVHYEISNFCLPGFESKHNKAYWERIPYLGIGPSAHSYNKRSRQWNCANQSEYLNAVSENKIPCQAEVLTITQQYNEYIMMGFRTSRGLNSKEIGNIFGEKYLIAFKNILPTYENTGKIIISDETASLTDEGKLFADRIIADFFVVD